MDMDPTTLGAVITAVFAGIGGTFGYKKLRNGSSNSVCAKHAAMHDQLVAGKVEFERINEKLDEQKELSTKHSTMLERTSLHLERIATTLDIMSQKGQ